MSAKPLPTLDFRARTQGNNARTRGGRSSHRVETPAGWQYRDGTLRCLFGLPLGGCWGLLGLAAAAAGAAAGLLLLLLELLGACRCKAYLCGAGVDPGAAEWPPKERAAGGRFPGCCFCATELCGGCLLLLLFYCVSI